MRHTIKTEKFEGPIAKLYELIEDRKLSVSDFSLLEITESFLDYTRSLDQMNFSKEEITHFISVASILILLKSKSLLPELELSETENRDILILENQLKAFEILKTKTKNVREMWGKNVLKNGKVRHESGEAIFVPDQKMNLIFFQNYINNRLLEIVPKEVERKEITVHKSLKIEDALSHVRNIIKRIKNLNFKNLGESGDERLREKNKRNVVILFLAVLELVKIGEIEANQEENFSDILVLENTI